jgi:hypothetical protein
MILTSEEQKILELHKNMALEEIKQNRVYGGAYIQSMVRVEPKNFDEDDEDDEFGGGIFLRDEGLEPPSFRKLLKEVGNQVITGLTLWREPISINKFVKFFKFNTGYDDLFHLSLNISTNEGNYNLDKQAVLTFEKGQPKGETLKINPPNSMTIQTLIDNTKNRMGKSKYTSYNAKSNNCQDFLLNVLDANGVNTTEATTFIKQDSDSIFKGLPKYADKILNIITTGQAILDRQMKGEGQIGGSGLMDLREPILKF